MKSIKPILILCATICCFASCKKEVDMTLVQKTMFENTDIRQIEAGSAWQVAVVTDSVTFVELSYSAYLEPYLKAKLDSAKLEIGFKGKMYTEPGSVFRATVHTNQFEKLEAKESAQVQCEGTFQGQRIELQLSDAAQCNGLIFSGTTCEINMEGASLLAGFQFVGNTAKAALKDASQFNGQIQAAQLLEINLSEASRFVNKGTMTELTRLHLSDASLLNMAETQCNTMEVELASGSEATVQVTDYLGGILREASTLYYKGNPEINIDCSEDSHLIPF